MFNKFFTFSLSAFIALIFTVMSFGQDSGPEPQMSLTHTPGDLNVTIFNEGTIGANFGCIGPGVTWLGVNGLYCGGVIFGSASTMS